jgi:glutathione S-transferase
MKYVFLNLQKQSPWIVKPVVNGICNKIDALFLGPNIKTHLDFLEGELGQRKWLAGEQFSGADIQVIFFSFKTTNVFIIYRQVLHWKC